MKAYSYSEQIFQVMKLKRGRFKAVKRCILFIVFSYFLVFPEVFSQTFSSSPVASIPDLGAQTCFSITPSGLPASINSAFELQRVCLDITHTYDEDLNIYLQAPDGEWIELSLTNGKQFNNYTATCFDQNASSRVREGAAPFTGSFRPEGNLNLANNGQNPNGTWNLCIQDLVSGDVGTLNNWSLTFGAPPACQVNTAISSLPYNGAGMTTCGAGNPFTSASACGSTYMNGDDYVFTYTPSAAEAISVSLSNADANAGLFIMDMCPSSLASRCMMSSTGSAAKLDTAILLEGHTYYIVVSSLPSPQCASFDISFQKVGMAGSDDCINATNINTTGRYFGDSHKAYPQTRSADPNVSTEFTCNATIDNIVYYKFTTDNSGGNIVIDISEVDCEYNKGIQFAVFQTASPCLGMGGWGAPIACEPKTLASITRTFSGLAPNTDFYILIDGFTGDECSWVLELSGPIALPVDFLSIKATNEENINTIQWVTTKEENNEYFIIERSTDGVNFETIGNRKGHGTTINTHAYIFKDNHPADGVNYYRIKQVDNNGQYSYSKVTAATLMNEDFFTVTNPAKVNEPIQLNFTESFLDISEVQVEVMDIAGRKPISTTLSIDNFDKDLLVDQSLSKGFYTISVSYNGTSYVRKFLIE